MATFNALSHDTAECGGGLYIVPGSHRPGLPDAVANKRVPIESPRPDRVVSRNDAPLPIEDDAAVLRVAWGVSGYHCIDEMARRIGVTSRGICQRKGINGRPAPEPAGAFDTDRLLPNGPLPAPGHPGKCRAI